MLSTFIKICGLTRSEDVQAAAELGADALGAVLYPASSRAVELSDLSSLFAALPGTSRRVALFVDADRSEVEAVCESGLIDCLQFHGSEPEAYCTAFGLPYIKALRVGSDQSFIEGYERYASAELILLDTFHRNMAGGTGLSFNWQLLAGVPDELKRKTVLAGGLNPENVAQAIAQTGVYGVDVSSGVESSPGIKDHEKLTGLIQAARNAGREGASSG